MRLSYNYENITVPVIVKIVAVVEVGLESSFKTGSHIIIRTVRSSHDLYYYMRSRLYLALPSLVDMSINNRYF